MPDAPRHPCDVSVLDRDRHRWNLLGDFERAADRTPGAPAACSAGRPAIRDATVPSRMPSASYVAIGSQRNLRGTESVSISTPREAVRSRELSTLDISAPSALVRGTPPKNAPLTRESVVTSLSAARFHYLLSQHHLLDLYPTLIQRITQGFPISLSLPTLSSSFLPPNHYRSTEDEAIIQEKVEAEVRAGRMSGPFTPGQAFEFFQGHFRTCPLALVPKALPNGAPGKGWRMVENFSFEDGDRVSVNMLIDSDDFPTSWLSALDFADWVCGSSLLFPLALLSFVSRLVFRTCC